MSFKKTFGIFIFFTGYWFVSLIGCSSESPEEQNARVFIKKVPVSIFRQFHWKEKKPHEQLVYQMCDSNRVIKIIDLNDKKQTSIKKVDLDSLSKSIHKIIPTLKNYSIIEVDGTLDCGRSVLFFLKNGDYIVSSSRNLDNIIGFKHIRKVLQEEWSYYKKK